MRQISLILGAWCLIFSLSGCTTLQQIILPALQPEPSIGAQILPPYSGPKARIAVAVFDIKTAKATDEIASGLRQMLITVLSNSNRFSIVESQALEVEVKEQESAASKVEHQAAQVEQANQIELGKIRVADLIITVAVTEFNPQTSGGRAGVGGGGGVGSGVFGGLLSGALNKAHLALDIGLIDPVTSEVLTTTRVQGQAADIGGAIMTGFSGDWGLSGGLSVYANTPMEKAIHICVIEAVKHIAETISPKYYRY